MSGATVESVDGVGAVVFVKPASQRLVAVASSQFDSSTLTGDELRVAIEDPAKAAAAAMELRRWSEVLDPGNAPAIAIVPGADDGETPVPKELLAEAAAGNVLIDPSLARAIGLDWVSLHNGGKRPASIAWAGPGKPAKPSSRRQADPPAAAAPLLGRGEEITVIASSWAAACGGNSRSLLLDGAAGAGKTRLLAEATEEITRAGGRVLYGAAERRAPTPYGPFVEALSGRNQPRGRGLVPFADLAAGATRDLPASAGLGNERSTLFGAAVAELERYCKRGPTALVIEDLHVCSRSSLALFRHLARSPDLSGLLLIGSYRSGESTAGSPLAELVDELGAEESTDRLSLTGLDLGPLRGLAVAFGAEGDEAAGLGELALGEAEGLPLHAGELIRTRAGVGESKSDADSPPSLQALTTARAESLGEETRKLLEAAALVGESFDPEVVRVACEVSAKELKRSLGEAEQARLIGAEADAATYRFEHALTRTHLTAGLGEGDRGLIHRRLAEAMEAFQGADGTVEAGRIAYQWSCAEPPEPVRAAAQSVLAAERALARFDPDAAIEWYERALELEGEQTTGEAERCDLLTGYGAALRLAGDARFRETLLEAAQIALDLDDVDRLVAAVLTNDRGFTSAIGEFDSERLAMLERAAERVDDEPRRALVLAQLALELTFSPEHERRHELAAEALALAEEADDPQLLARVLNRHLIARWEPSNARERISTANRGIEISSDLADSLDLFHGLHWRAGAQLEAGEIDGARRSVERETALAGRLGDPTAAWLAECSHSVHLALVGQLAEAEDSAERALRLGSASAQPDALPFFATQIAAIRWQQGRLGELAELLDQAISDHPGLPAFRSLVALARAEAGNADGARQIIAGDALVDFARLPRDPAWLNGIATYAHVAADVGDRDAAGKLFGLLEPVRGQIATASTSVWGTTDHALGRLASTLDMDDTAIVYLERALAEYERIGAPVWKGQAALDLGIALRVSGRDRTREAALIDEARGIALRYEAKLLMRELPSRGSAPPPSSYLHSQSGGETVSERLGALDLTDRQRDVVALVVRGLSNKQVAAELEISPATVKRHLEGAFKRAEVSGRKGLMELVTR